MKFQQRRSSAMAWLGAACLGALSSGCAGGPKLPGLPAIPSGADLSKLAIVGQSSEPSQLPLPSAEIYSRIARGANACWFGARGRIRSTHILHADVAPSMTGGAVEIVVHERAVDQPKPWGYKAFRISLAESPGLTGASGEGGTTISVENARMSDPEASRMRAEVYQWATGTEGCKTDPVLDRQPDTAATTIAAPPEVPNKSPPNKPAPKSAASATPEARKP
jgi:hypothetical protein